MQKKESLDATGRGNSYTNWATITKEHETFKACMLNAKIHLVCTIRSKQDYNMDVDDKGKKTIIKVGMAPIQREGIEYEYTTVFDISMKHEASVSKDRTGLFEGQIAKIDEGTGKQFIDWLASATPEPIEPATAEIEAEPNFDDGPPPFNKFDNPNADLKMEVGQYTGKTFSETLKADSVNNFRLAKWAAGELRKPSHKMHPCYEKYVEYALSESVNLE